MLLLRLFGRRPSFTLAFIALNAMLDCSGSAFKVLGRKIHATGRLSEHVNRCGKSLGCKQGARYPQRAASHELSVSSTGVRGSGWTPNCLVCGAKRAGSNAFSNPSTRLGASCQPRVSPCRIVSHVRNLYVPTWYRALAAEGQRDDNASHRQGIMQLIKRHYWSHGRI